MPTRIRAVGVVVATGLGITLGEPRNPQMPALSAAAAGARPAPRPALMPAPLAFQGVTVVDVQDGRLRPEQTVVITGTRITAVGPAHAVRVPVGAQRVDARGKYLIPGLWDMHTHPVDHPEFAYPLYVANGVTGIRNAGT